MTDKKLTPEDARALLGDHLEGSLADDVRTDVDALLASDPELAAEHRRLQGTLALLKALPTPDAPVDMVGKVRDRLAAERRDASRSAEEPRDNVVRPRRWFGIEAAIGLAAAASIAVFIAVAGPTKDTTGDTAAAGIAGDTAAVTSTIVVPDVPTAAVDDAAVKAGMVEVTDGVYEGGRREAARFMMALKTMAAERNVEVSGFVPDAEKVRVEVKSR